MAHRVATAPAHPNNINEDVALEIGEDLVFAGDRDFARALSKEPVSIRRSVAQYTAIEDDLRKNFPRTYKLLSPFRDDQPFDGEPLDSLAIEWSRCSGRRIAYPKADLELNHWYLLAGSEGSKNAFPPPPSRFQSIHDTVIFNTKGRYWAILRFKKPPTGVYFDSIQQGEAHAVGQFVGYETILASHAPSQRLPVFNCSAFCIWNGPFYDTGDERTP